jgi:hypothetical protein
MGAEISLRRRATTTLSWPLGIVWTAWHYVWRILPVHRTEAGGTLADDLPPSLPDEFATAPDVQRPRHGSGPLLHRLYSARIVGAELSAEELMARISADPNRVTPRQIARFHRDAGARGPMRTGDEYLVHMPGPWNGPVRAVAVWPTGFRFATLEGHLEAGQIEWRAWEDTDGLRFAVESWARQGDRLSTVMHDHLLMAKEVQLYMWTTVVERVARLAGGRLADGVSVDTRRVPAEVFT